MDFSLESTALHCISEYYLLSDEPYESNLGFVKDILGIIDGHKAELPLFASSVHERLMQSMAKDTPYDFMMLVHRLSCSYGL